MRPHELPGLDRSLRSTWESYTRFLRECLWREDYQPAIELIEAAQPDAWLAMQESDYSACSAALWASVGHFDNAVDVVRQAKRFGYPRFYFFDPAWGSHSLRFDDGKQQWVFPDGRAVPDSDPQGPYVLHRYLRSLYASDVIQSYVQANFRARKTPAGFDIESTPLCWVEKTTLGRKRAKCEVSGKRVEKGEDVLEVRYFNGADDIPTKPSVVLPDEFASSDAAKSNLEKYEGDAYAVEEFAFKTSYSNPVVCSFWHDLLDFDIDNALDLIATSRVGPTPYALKGNDEEAVGEVQINAGAGGKLVDLLWVLIKCGYFDSIVERLGDLPDHFPLLLMLFDRPAMRRCVSERLGLPGLVQVYETVSKSRLAAKDVAFLARFGDEHPEFQRLLAESLNRYEYHLYSNYVCSPNWFYADFRGFVRARGRHFLYLFASSPELVPALAKMKSQRRLVGRQGSSSEGVGYTHATDAFYGTLLLHCAMVGDSALDFWLTLPSQTRIAKELLAAQRLVLKAAKLLAR